SWRRISDVAVLSFIRAAVQRQNLGAGRPFHSTVRRTYAPNKNCPSDHLLTRRIPPSREEMSMTVIFEERDSGTEVTILFEQIPPGIRLEDNDAGTRSSLEKLARYVE